MDKNREEWKNYIGGVIKMIVEELFSSKLTEASTHVREENTFYVTDLVRCPLKLKFEEKYKELQVAEQVKPATVLGDLVHAGLEKFLSDKFSAKTEVEGQKEVTVGQIAYKVKGRADAIIEKDKRVVIEIKTARADKGIPLEHHKQQLRIYLWLFDALEGILVYVTPDRVTEYLVADRVDDIEVIRLVEETVKAVKTPRYSWECSYCIFNVMCPSKKVK